MVSGVVVCIVLGIPVVVTSVLVVLLGASSGNANEEDRGRTSRMNISIALSQSLKFALVEYSCSGEEWGCSGQCRAQLGYIHEKNLPEERPIKRTDKNGVFSTKSGIRTAQMTKFPCVLRMLC